MAEHIAETVTLDRLQYSYSVLLDPRADSAVMYDPLLIPGYLRTRNYDLQLATGAALVAGEAQFDPNEDWNSYEVRWGQLSNVRERIENDPDFSVRTLLGQGALRQVLGATYEGLSQKELIRRQVAAVELIATDVENGYEIGVVPYTADTGAVASGRFMLVHSSDPAAHLLLGSMRRGDYVEARGNGSLEEVRALERAQRAFDNLWEASVTDPEKVADYMALIATDLENLI